MSKAFSITLGGICAALWLCGCSGETTPPAGVTSGSSGASAGASTNGSGSSASGGSSGTSASGSSGSGASSGSSASSGASGSSGAAAPQVSGTITYDAQALTHPAWIALYDHPPVTHDVPLALQATASDGTYALGLDGGGAYYLYAAYAPGRPDAGPLGPDGGLAAGFVLGEALHDPLAIAGPVTADVDVTPLTAIAVSLTVNASMLAGTDAGLPAGATALPDGGALYPLLLQASLGGVDPESGLPVSDGTAATFGTDAGASFTMAYVSTGGPGDLDYQRYGYTSPLSNPASWKPAEDATYFFSLAGSAALGATVSRQLALTPFTSVPIIAAPADGATLSFLSPVQVAWVDPSGASGAEVKVIEVPAGTTLCDLAYPQHTPVTLSGSNGCNLQILKSYRIEVTSYRFHAQPQGAAIEGAYAKVRVTIN